MTTVKKNATPEQCQQAIAIRQAQVQKNLTMIEELTRRNISLEKEILVWQGGLGMLTGQFMQTVEIPDAPATETPQTKAPEPQAPSNVVGLTEKDVPNEPT